MVINNKNEKDLKTLTSILTKVGIEKENFHFYLNNINYPVFGLTKYKNKVASSILYNVLYCSEKPKINIYKDFSLTKEEFSYLVLNSDINLKLDMDSTPAMKLFSSEYFNLLDSDTLDTVFTKIDFRLTNFNGKNVLSCMLDSLKFYQLNLAQSHWDIAIRATDLDLMVSSVQDSIDFMDLSFYKIIKNFNKLDLHMGTWEYIINNTGKAQEIITKYKSQIFIDEDNYKKFENLKAVINETKILDLNITENVGTKNLNNLLKI